MSELKVILADLRCLFTQQIPSSIYLFFIGLSASILGVVFDKTDAGKNASNFLEAITSGIKQFEVFVSVALIFLFVSSLQSTFATNLPDESIDSFPKGLSMRSIAVNGLFSFLVPLVSLLFGMTFALSALLYANPKLALVQKVSQNSVLGLGGSALLLLSFLLLFYFMSTWERACKSKLFSIFLNFAFLFLIIVSFFELTK